MRPDGNFAASLRWQSIGIGFVGLNGGAIGMMRLSFTNLEQSRFTSTSSNSSSNPRSPSLAYLLGSFSIVLLVVFLATVLTAILPPRLMAPQWQLQAIAVLINSAPLALLAAILLALAVWLDPANDRLRARYKTFRQWSIAPALGFLLLIPLQGHAAWRLYRDTIVAQQQQSSQSSRKLTALRQAFTSAANHKDLQRKIKELVGKSYILSPYELRTPMPELRQQLMARLDQASNQLMQQIEAQARTKPDQLEKATLKIAISSLAYGAGFGLLAGALPLRQRRLRGDRLSPVKAMINRFKKSPRKR